MSRIGKAPVAVPSGVTIDVAASRELTVKGPGGTLKMPLRPEVQVKVDGSEALVELTGTGSARQARAFHGLTRALLNNMVTGVTRGFEKKLEIIGVGWNAKAKRPNQIELNIGFCHPVVIDMPDGVTVETPKPTQITIKGADRQAVGHITAVIRKVRPPEPYKGKGIRYEGEYVRRKAGKSFGS
ncbi:MAG: 50S ribosomal protein L6 [bacterium]|jgi:large subunit ribosomal protein L6|nr:50S ribosomal protein L6 [Planctomycetota bacterium]HIL51327.1 50S ribosomal protein L6 [Planctomycetota bacterium]